LNPHHTVFNTYSFFTDRNRTARGAPLFPNRKTAVFIKVYEIGTDS
jgi:hypothetical protein